MSKNKKLTKEDCERMWGEDQPYSQVRLCEEVRILGDGVSRVFLVVEAEINPFTFEYILEYREKFKDDQAIQQLLDHADYRDKHGYIVYAGETELRGKESVDFAQEQASAAVQTLIKMHAFIIDEFGLEKNSGFGVVKDPLKNENFIWNSLSGQIEPADDEIWDEETLVGSPAGICNNKARFYFVLPFGRDFEHKKESAMLIIKNIKKTSAHFKAEIEEVESFQEYFFMTVLLPFEIAPADYIETFLNKCNTMAKKIIFQKNYLINNTKRPSPKEIMSFLGHLPR